MLRLVERGARSSRLHRSAFQEPKGVPLVKMESSPLTMPKKPTCSVYVVPLGINLTLLSVVTIAAKIWFRPVIGCAEEMQLLLPPVAV